MPSPNQPSIICGLDLCHLIKDYTLPFPLISLFCFNLPFSTTFFLNIYGCVLLFPNLHNKPEKPSLDFILTSKYLSISLFFLTVKFPNSLVSRFYFYFSHSHVNHFTSVSPFPTTLKITGDTHHVKYNRGTCLISSICQQSVPTHVLPTHIHQQAFSFRKHFPRFHNLVVPDTTFLVSLWHLPFSCTPV